MAIRFRKSVSLGNGIKININKKSVGLSLGGKGGRVIFNSSGRITTSSSIPGSGISFHESFSLNSKAKNKQSKITNTNSIIEEQYIPTPKQIDFVKPPVEDSIERMMAFLCVGIKAINVSPYGDPNLCVVCGKKKSIFCPLSKYGYCEKCNEKARKAILNLIDSVNGIVDFALKAEKANSNLIDDDDVLIKSALKHIDELEAVRPYAPFFKSSLEEQRQILESFIK